MKNNIILLKYFNNIFKNLIILFIYFKKYLYINTNNSKNKIKEDFSDMDWEKLRTFPFCNSSVEDLQWKNILERSRIRERLAELLGG